MSSKKNVASSMRSWSKVLKSNDNHHSCNNYNINSNNNTTRNNENMSYTSSLFQQQLEASYNQCRSDEDDSQSCFYGDDNYGGGEEMDYYNCGHRDFSHQQEQCVDCDDEADVNEDIELFCMPTSASKVAAANTRRRSQLGNQLKRKLSSSASEVNSSSSSKPENDDEEYDDGAHQEFARFIVEQERLLHSLERLLVEQQDDISDSQSDSSSDDEQILRGHFTSRKVDTEPRLCDDEVNIIIQEFIDAVHYDDEKDNPHHQPDRYAPFDSSDSTDSTKTKQSFCRGLQKIIALNGWTISSVNDLLELLHKYLTGYRLPVHISKKTGNITNTIAKYLPKDVRHLQLDICMKGCCVFAGSNKHAIKCPTCKTPRYSLCAHHSCKNRVSCNPFHNEETPDDIRTQAHANRTPLRVCYYRAVIPKLVELYKLSVTEKKDLFNYDNLRYKRKGVYSDILDGSAAKDAMEKMNQAYNRQKSRFAVHEPEVVLHDCSLILTAFYDGKNLFDHKKESIWPMVFSVGNCDPCFRTKLGLGFFVVALHSSSNDSEVERFILDGLMTRELEMLEQGLVLRLKIGGKLHVVFLQARLIFFHLDTKAIEKFFHVQASGAMHGCPFCPMKGLSRPSFRAFTGHRVYLCADHILRFLGECDEMPDGYHDGSIQRNQEIFQSKKEESELVTLDRNVPLPTAAAKKARKAYLAGLTKKEKEDQIALDKYNAALKKKKFTDLIDHPPRSLNTNLYSWYDDKSSIDEFLPAIWAAYEDHRPALAFARVTHEEYVQRGSIAKERMTKYLAELAAKMKPLPAKLPDKNEEGVHNVSDWATKLLGPKFDNMSYDFMHYVKNCVDYILKIIMGERISEESMRLALAEKRFPFLKVALPSDKLPWEATLGTRHLADTVLNTLLIPKLFKSSFQFKNVFRQSGSVNSFQKLIFGMHYMPYILSFTDVNEPYQKLFERFSRDLCNVYSPFVEDTDLERICNLVFETRSLHELMLTDGEQAVVVHQIVEIANNIAKMGATRSQACYFGERSMKTIAAGCPTGGVNFDKTLYERYVAKEKSFEDNWMDYESNLKRYIDNLGRYNEFNLKLLGKSYTAILSRLEKELFMEYLYGFLRANSISNLELRSPFFRIYRTYLELQKATKPSSTAKAYKNVAQWSFLEWVDQVLKIYTDSPSHKFYERILTVTGGCTFIDDKSTYRFQNHDLPEVIALKEQIIVEQVLQGLTIITEDLFTILPEIQQFGTIQVHNEAIIKGLEHQARGAQFSESMEPVNVTYNGTDYKQPRNDKNNILEHWHSPLQFSAWAKVVDWQYTDSSESSDPYKYLVQSNYFFRLVFKHDSFISGLAFANVVTRNSDILKTRGNVTVMDRLQLQTFSQKHRFFSLNYYESTKLALSVVDNKWLPMSHKEDYHSFGRDTNDDKDAYLSKQNRHDVHKIVFLNMHNERMSFQYTSITGEDWWTKVFEE